MFNLLIDTRVNCYSILTEMKLSDYLSLVERAYENEGGIKGQRGALKTKTAITIRKRLVADVKDGAVIPPVVIGFLYTSEKYKELEKLKDVKELVDEAANADQQRISIIDGMQRTTAMLDAYTEDKSIGDKIIRVEFWIAEKVNSLIYRMLVLNTGQIPWDIGRQLETIYGQFLTQIKESMVQKIDIFTLADNRRRSHAGQYQSKNIIELLLIFSSRQSEIQTKDKVAEDFARLEAIETTSHNDFMPFFITTMEMFVNLDSSISQLEITGEYNQRLKSGKDLFSSFPAMAGFFAAVSVSIFDEPGFDIEWEMSPEKMVALKNSVDVVCDKMKNLNQEQLGEFLQLELLEQRIQQKSGRVGQFERQLFFRAFTSMFKNADRLNNFEPCWRS